MVSKFGRVATVARNRSPILSVVDEESALKYLAQQGATTGAQEQLEQQLLSPCLRYPVYIYSETSVTGLS